MATKPASCLRVSRAAPSLRRTALAAAIGMCLSPVCTSIVMAQVAAPEVTPAQPVQTQPAPTTTTQPASVQAPATQNPAAQTPAPQVQAPQIQPSAPSQAPAPGAAPAAPASQEPAGSVQQPASPAAAAPFGSDAGQPQPQPQPQTVLPSAPLGGPAGESVVITESETEILPDLPPLTPPEGEQGLHDLSPWGMYQQADIVVKAVMIGLVLASLATWTIWVAKSLELFFARRRVRKGIEVLRQAQTLGESEATFRINRAGGTVPQLVRGAIDEAKRSADLPAEGIKERAEILLSRIEARAGRRMGVGTGVLASIGSVAPFVGLFGTVWGIMNSFIGIAKSNTTNLAVVAPGIAEALLATAIGLVAAIPAVVIYNMFARSISGYRALLGDASAEVQRHLSRDLDRAATGHQPGNPRVSNLRSAAE
ncbi:tonB-system energizer ExbB [Pseudochelatococcus contaminans]|uniref:Biopolymer transport protein ExbB n=1 Tax=Pseudochelatococcus contaminans TaxID=1538103 RepID=A0A7W5Z4X2_9HYPH|nr:tonB-system energizer ExbB [Pseudochelatococcus contaminans]MBB3810162.1 biopolymer transport protein ExbB [Pseudochelatococcus contaminans]